MKVGSKAKLQKAKDKASWMSVMVGKHTGSVRRAHYKMDYVAYVYNEKSKHILSKRHPDGIRR